MSECGVVLVLIKDEWWVSWKVLNWLGHVERTSGLRLIKSRYEFEVESRWDRDKSYTGWLDRVNETYSVRSLELRILKVKSIGSEERNNLIVGLNGCFNLKCVTERTFDTKQRGKSLQPSSKRRYRECWHKPPFVDGVVSRHLYKLFRGVRTCVLREFRCCIFFLFIWLTPKIEKTPFSKTILVVVKLFPTSASSISTAIRQTVCSSWYNLEASTLLTWYQ